MTQEIENQFMDYLDELYESAIIYDIKFLPSTILKKLDPTAYNVYLQEFKTLQNALTEKKEED